MALNSLFCADMLLRNYSLTHFWKRMGQYCCNLAQVVHRAGDGTIDFWGHRQESQMMLKLDMETCQRHCSWPFWLTRLSLNFLYSAVTVEWLKFASLMGNYHHHPSIIIIIYIIHRHHRIRDHHHHIHHHRSFPHGNTSVAARVTSGCI